ncbi:MAG: hypothetical protein N3D11_10060 [Candidatus Sumerlaeia bacterium]|nr:hypothetical protein [Candidatus Sumerlaeia bacterium]
MKHLSACRSQTRAAPCREVRPRPLAPFALRRLLFAFLAVLSAAPVAADSWMSMDVGNAAAGATAINANTTFTVTGCGDIGGTSDSFRFVYLRAKGDCEITARLVVQKAPPPAALSSTAQAGIMIRQNLSSATLCAALLRTPTGRVQFQWRLTPLGITAARSDRGLALPCWLRLRRNGHTLCAYYAGETAGRPGTYAKLGGDVVIAMNDPVYVGLCVSSALTDTPSTAIFDHVATAGAFRPGAGLILGHGSRPSNGAQSHVRLAQPHPRMISMVFLSQGFLACP